MNTSPPMVMRCFFSLLLMFIAHTGAALDRSQLTYKQLTQSEGIAGPVVTDAFAIAANAQLPDQALEGKFSIAVLRDKIGFNAIKDHYNIVKTRPKARYIPTLEFSWVQDGHDIIPRPRRSRDTDHPHWEYFIQPGKIWKEEADQGFNRVALPFSLRERNANCTHNGLLSFLVKADGTVSNVFYQIGSETCLYFKFDMWGWAQLDYKPVTVSDRQLQIDRHRENIQLRLPTYPIAQLGADVLRPGLVWLADSLPIAPADMSAYGFVINGKHYVGGCQTRYGTYPYCDVLALPSYSLAKTLFAGLGLMHLEKRYPGISQLKIADYVPACKKNGNWHDVSFQHALDMTTGNYDSRQDRGDEWAAVMEEKFFLPETHAEKIRFACGHYPRQAEPGEVWVYHTTDTYILGTAINNFLKIKNGGQADLFTDMFRSLWRSEHLSSMTGDTLRTYDRRQQAFTGYGLTFYRDDIARIATAINRDDSVIAQQLAPAMFNAAMQRDPQHRGAVASNAKFRYQHGFWAYDVGEALGCKAPLWLPFMSGYGGINVVMMPNDTIYYYFSDSGKFSWLDAAKTSHVIRAMC